MYIIHTQISDLVHTSVSRITFIGYLLKDKRGERPVIYKTWRTCDNQNRLRLPMPGADEA